MALKSVVNGQVRAINDKDHKQEDQDREGSRACSLKTYADHLRVCGVRIERKVGQGPMASIAFAGHASRNRTSQQPGFPLFGWVAAAQI
jgi:hypothetical protein